MGRRRRRRRRSSRPAPETRTPGTGKAVMDTFMTGGRGATGSQTPEQKEKAMFERFKAQLGNQATGRASVASSDPNTIQPSDTGKFSTQAGLERLKANRPDFMKPRPMTNQGAIATNMAQTAQGKIMAPEGYKPQQSSMPGGKGAVRAGRSLYSGGGGKGGQRPLAHGGPGTGVAGPRLGPDDRPMPPRPQRPMGGGGKGMQRPAGGGFGKGGQRPSPSMGRPNPYAGMSQAQISAQSENKAQPAPNVSVEQVAPMTKKAPSFKMRSGNSTTFKEMGGDKKKSAPVKKTGGGYKMPGFGKR